MKNIIYNYIFVLNLLQDFIEQWLLIWSLNKFITLI